MQFVVSMTDSLLVHSRYQSVKLVPLGSESYRSMARPTLALLGGFSATVVYHILERLLETVESLVRGETADILEAQEQAAKAHLNQELVQSRFQLATDLLRFRQQVDDAAGTEELKQKLDQMLEGLIPSELKE
jgi:hypothetical protein